MRHPFPLQSPSYNSVLTKIKTDYLPDWRRFCKFDAQKARKRAKNRA